MPRSSRENSIVSAEFVRRAIALARENVRSSKGGPFGAVVVKNGCIIAKGKRSSTDQMRLCHVHLATTKVMSSRCS